MEMPDVGQRMTLIEVEMTAGATRVMSCQGSSWCLMDESTSCGESWKHSTEREEMMETNDL